MYSTVYEFLGTNSGLPSAKFALPPMLNPLVTPLPVSLIQSNWVNIWFYHFEHDIIEL